MRDEPVQERLQEGKEICVSDVVRGAGVRGSGCTLVLRKTSGLAPWNTWEQPEEVSGKKTWEGECLYRFPLQQEM